MLELLDIAYKSLAAVYYGTKVAFGLAKGVRAVHELDGDMIVLDIKPPISPNVIVQKSGDLTARALREARGSVPPAPTHEHQLNKKLRKPKPSARGRGSCAR